MFRKYLNLFGHTFMIGFCSAIIEASRNPICESVIAHHFRFIMQYFPCGQQIYYDMLEILAYLFLTVRGMVYFSIIYFFYKRYEEKIWSILFKINIIKKFFLYKIYITTKFDTDEDGALIIKDGLDIGLYLLFSLFISVRVDSDFMICAIFFGIPFVCFRYLVGCGPVRLLINIFWD